MYIDNLHYTNIGPISDLKIQFRKNKNGVPVPLVIVGKNGSGKSILLSNIVDAFYELGNEAYDNAMEANGNGGFQYYKAISSEQIKIGQNYMVAHLSFRQSNKKFEYLFKSGKLSFNEYVQLHENAIDQKLSWKGEINFKKVTVDKEDINNIFEKDIVCFFGPNRYMKPSWMGDKYFVSDEVDKYSLRPRYARRLNNPITAVNLSYLTLQWLFDIITDSRADLEKYENSYRIISPSTNDLDLLSISRHNAEMIMSAILDKDIIFSMGNRSLGKRRFSILKKIDRTELVPTLDALSTGQLALFNMNEF